jgi:hypothetical protein
MQIRRGRVGKWTYATVAAILAIVLLFWFEWLGSERSLTTTEVPVSQPVAKQKTGLHVEK